MFFYIYIPYRENIRCIWNKCFPNNIFYIIIKNFFNKLMNIIFFVLFEVFASAISSFDLHVVYIQYKYNFYIFSYTKVSFVSLLLLLHICIFYTKTHSIFHCNTYRFFNACHEYLPNLTMICCNWKPTIQLYKKFNPAYLRPSRWRLPITMYFSEMTM